MIKRYLIFQSQNSRRRSIRNVLLLVWASGDYFSFQSLIKILGMNPEIWGTFPKLFLYFEIFVVRMETHFNFAEWPKQYNRVKYCLVLPNIAYNEYDKYTIYCSRRKV